MATMQELIAGQLPTENDLLADNPWYMAGRQIQGMQVPQAQNNTQALLLPILQGLAGGGLMGYGKGQAYESGYDQYRNNPLLKAMVGSDTESLDGTAPLSPYASETMPEGWTPKVGKTDLLQALAAKQLADEAAAKKAEFDNSIEAQIAVKTDPRILAAEGLKTSAEFAKEKEKNLREDTKITYDRIKGLPEATKLAELEPNVKLATESVNKSDKASGKAFVKAIIKIQDPTSVVSSTEIRVAEDVLPFLEKHLGANWRSIALGQSELSPKARKGMLEAVMPVYNATGSAYEEKKGRILDIFEQAQGGDRTKIPVSTWKPIDIGEKKSPPPPLPGESKADYIARVKG